MTPAKKKGRSPRKPAPTEGEIEKLRQLQIEAERLKAKLLQAQLERDILQETINILKSRPRRRPEQTEERGEGNGDRRPAEPVSTTHAAEDDASDPQ
ncbi:MAG: hypothetical protein QM270_02895 [Bacillota bacterium]|nr:hypothetical protein [Bacillota bacterium]